MQHSAFLFNLFFGGKRGVDPTSWWLHYLTAIIKLSRCTLP